MEDFQPLRDLEARRPGPFTYRVGGLQYSGPDPAALHFEDLMLLMRERDLIIIPRMAAWMPDVVFERWAAHHDLPSFEQAQRLAYVVNRYRDTLEHDLHIHARVDLTTLWRERRWRFLLNLIDHLPRNSFYSEAVANDPEHARMLAEAQAQHADDTRDEEGPSGPPMHTWSAEVAAIVDLTDAVRRVEYAVVAVQADKGKGPKPPEPLPRPVSILDRERKRAAYDVRKARHDKLAARMLPHKRASEAE